MIPLYTSGAGALENSAGFQLLLDDAGSGAVNTTPQKSGGVGTPTFTRAGATATTIGSSGLVLKAIGANVARSYYDPTSLIYGGYLAEVASTNLLLRSEEFDDAAWTKTDTVITADNTTSPDGTVDADLCTEGSAGTASVAQTVTATADASYAVSQFFKVGNTPWVQFVVINGANAFRGWFNLSTGVVGSTAVAGTGTVTSIEIKAYPNGWYRCSLTGTVGSAATSITVTTFNTNADASTTRVNGATRFVWGAQFEDAKTFVTTYIPTTTATVTRAADVLSYTATGNASQTTGTIYCEGTPLVGVAVQRIAVSIDDTSDNERIIIDTAGATNVMRFIVVDGGVTQCVISSAATTVNVASKYAASYSLNNFAFSVNGGAVGTDLSGSLPTTTQISLGSSHGILQWNGTIKNVRIWLTQLTDAQIQYLTV